MLRCVFVCVFFGHGERTTAASRDLNPKAMPTSRETLRDTSRPQRRSSLFHSAIHGCVAVISEDIWHLKRCLSQVCCVDDQHKHDLLVGVQQRNKKKRHVNDFVGRQEVPKLKRSNIGKRPTRPETSLSFLFDPLVNHVFVVSTRVQPTQPICTTHMALHALVHLGDGRGRVRR